MFIEMPGGAWPSPGSLHPMRKAGAERVAPAAGRLVADDHIALEQQLVDVALAQVEPETCQCPYS